MSLSTPVPPSFPLISDTRCLARHASAQLWTPTTALHTWNVTLWSHFRHLSSFTEATSRHGGQPAPTTTFSIPSSSAHRKKQPKIRLNSTAFKPFGTVGRCLAFGRLSSRVVEAGESRRESAKASGGPPSMCAYCNQTQAVSSSHPWRATVSHPTRWMDKTNNGRCAWIELDRCSAWLSSSIA